VAAAGAPRGPRLLYGGAVVPPFSAAVLAGGRSRRFGRDKARFVWRGKPLLGHVLDSLSEADESFVVANRPYPGFGVPVYPDVIPGGDSLSGIHAALFHARNRAVAVAACDLPNLTPGYWAFLLERLEDAPAVVAMGPEDWPEPLAAVYTKALLPLAERLLKSGDYFIRRLLDEGGARYLPWREVRDRFGSSIFANVNRPEDLESLSGWA